MAEVMQWWERMEEARSPDCLKVVDGEQASRWQEVMMVVDLSTRDGSCSISNLPIVWGTKNLSHHNALNGMGKTLNDFILDVVPHPVVPPEKPLTSSRLFADMKMKCILGLVVLVAVSAWAEQEAVQTISASERIERVNRGIVRSPDEPYIEDDVAYDSEAERNADPCTSRNCKWPKSADGNVYVAYTISNEFSPREVSVIERGLQSFHDVSCIRFVKRYGQKDYLNIQSLNGCWSYLGRLANGQNLSLRRSGCVYFDTVQHEVLHALGFHHEQKRSDRDQYIRIVMENVTPGKEHNFAKINTLNQETTYDYGSVMHYHKYAFSKNNQPTLVAIPDSSVEFGRATEMSQKDIIRLNRLYQC
ncbi:High choriolytic enzyme 1 [Collichthys lucidus]|uniref:Metalloendopeptidase n=1 Tax=Collichthys lucidus TaxID=240159 RepID=A0A4V6ANR0_COLLU|nr:High choriolytic enzyme 1 [Collichthys lucidus]